MVYISYALPYFVADFINRVSCLPHICFQFIQPKTSTTAAMSFGFGVGDFLAVADLAWKLYRYCYIVAKDAPRDFKLLLQEICTLASSLKLLKDEVDDPESTLRRSGEDRVRMVNDMISRIGMTLEELEKYAKRYESLQGVPRSKRKKLWDRFTWSIEGSEIDSLRVKVNF